MRAIEYHALSSASVVDLNPAALGLLAQHGLLRPLLRQIQLQNALAQESVQDEERQQAVAAFAQERQLGDAEELEQWRQEQLLSREALLALIERPLRLRRHCERLYRPKAEARFLDRKNQLDRVVYSLIRLGDEGLARELYLRLEDEECSFADLAATYSEGPERSTRGVVGPIPSWWSVCARPRPGLFRNRFGSSGGGWCFGWNRSHRQPLMRRWQSR
jgi:parvulin-like peptidyl-prolyl isomerase